MVETPKQDIDLNVDRQTFKGFDETIKNKGRLFVEQMDIAETKDKKGEIQEKAAAFMLNSGIMLGLILTDMSDANKLATIDATNIKEPKLQTYIDAKQAFDTDMKALNVSDPKITKLLGDIQNLIDLKSIEANPEYVKDFDKKRTTELLGLAKLPATQKILTERLTFLESKETDILNSLLNATPSLTIAQELFDKNQIARNALIAKNRTNTDQNKSKQQQNFETLLLLYGQKAGMEKVNTYEVKKFKNQDAYIHIEGTGPVTKQDIMLGTSTDVLHRARAEEYKGTTERKETANKINEKGEEIVPSVPMTESELIQYNLDQLDGKGSYVQFENILKGQKNPESFLSGLLGKNLLEGINTTKTNSDREAKINRYYGVILDYIISTKNEGLLSTYLNHIVVNNKINTEYLGTDNKNQIENLKKIINKNIQWTMSESSPNREVLIKIQSYLIKQDPKDFRETLSKGLDTMIEQFGPLLLGLLKMLGFSKGFLSEKFGAERINKMFQKEYGLSGDKYAAIVNFSKNFLDTKITTAEGKDIRLETGEDIKKQFDEKQQSEYIKLMIDEGYYKNISIGVFKKGLEDYNKEKKTGTNINDIVSIEIDNDTKEERITGIKEDNNTFRGVIESILKNDATWTRIAKANDEIKTEKKDKDGNSTGLNEQGVLIGQDSDRYLIQSQSDIARYLTASLFSNKDLGYVMTENKLHNNAIITKQKNPETPVSTETLTFKSDLANEEGIIMTGVKDKMVSDAIDMTNAPSNLLFTPKGVSAIKIERKKDATTTDNKTIDTYIYTEGSDKGKIVRINEGDKIEAIPAERSIAEKRTEVKTELDKQPTKTAKTKFEGGTYTLDNKNIYEKEVQKISNIFTEKGSYDSLISETSQITLGTMVKNNMSDIKNMFTFWGLKQRENKDEAYKIDKMTLDKDITNNIDVSKQTFTIKEAKDKTITIEVKKNPDEATNTAKEGSITIKNTDGKLTTERKETPAKA